MGDKSTQKKQYIIEKAKEVFAKRGYKDVTMKDIVDACGISRGGLYLYFGNTKDLFEAVLEQQTQNTKSSYEASLPENAAPGDQLLLYLDICKKEMLAKDNLLQQLMNICLPMHRIVWSADKKKRMPDFWNRSLQMA